MKLPTRILIIRLGALGDIVHTLPILDPLRREIPDAYIAWMAEDTWAPLLTHHTLIDEVIAIPKKRWRAGFLRPWNWLDTLSEVLDKRRDVVANRFDMAVDFQGNLKSGSIIVFCGARERIGYGRAGSRELNPIFLTRRVPFGENRIHRSEKALQLVRSVVGEAEYKRPDIPTSLEDDRFARAAVGDRRGRPVVAIHPATSSFGAVKRWPIESFAAVGDALAEKHGASVFVTWGPGEKDLAEQVSRAMSRPARVSPETRELGQLVALLRECDLFIGSDTGPLHIASAVGTPVVAIFGPKDPAVYGPRGAPHRIVRVDLPCSPCTKRKCDNPICMTSITPEAVTAAAAELLAP